MRNFLLSFLLFSYCSFDSYLFASDEFEEQSFITTHIAYSQKEEEKVTSFEHEGIGRYTSSYNIDKIQENVEFILYDEESPQYVASIAEDGRVEFTENREKKQKGKDKIKFVDQDVQRIAQCAEFDNQRIYKISSNKIQTTPYRLLGNLLMTFPHSQDGSSVPPMCIGSG
ncbi:MAG: hypothetical protein IBJ00_03135, partial [Alphaproteobacteria bacterium]|nr:hypothetical protein [Alphaproteobacteria bacterium]